MTSLTSALEAEAARAGAVLTRHPLRHRAGRYALLRIASSDLRSPDPVVLVRAGIHGDETAGPMTLARRLGAILEHARARRVQLVCYPLGNPSGFARGLRYNADHDAGAEGNNDFLRYRREDGTLASSVAPGERFRRFHWSSEPGLGIALPAETRLMHALLAREPLARVRAALDLHQDHLTPGAPAAAYHYAFGDLDAYAGIVARVARLCPLLAGQAIGAGFGARIDAAGRVLGPPAAQAAVASDARGFIVRHDGTLSDLLHRLGVRHSVAPETTGATPMDVAVAVNLVWIRGLVDLVAGGG